jgi:hypothetical protein
MNRPKITHVAIRFRGTVYSLPEPNRHHNVIRHIVDTEGVSHVDSYGEDQGFLDETGRYLTRKQALVSAQLNDQIKEGSTIYHGELYSENLW